MAASFSLFSLFFIIIIKSVDLVLPLMFVVVLNVSYRCSLSSVPYLAVCSKSVHLLFIFVTVSFSISLWFLLFCLHELQCASFDIYISVLFFFLSFCSLRRDCFVRFTCLESILWTVPLLFLLLFLINTYILLLLTDQMFRFLHLILITLILIRWQVFSFCICFIPI